MDEFLLGLRTTLVLIHLVGFAGLLGGWFAQLATRKPGMNVVLRTGLGVMIVSGLLLAIPFPAGVELDYAKLAVKLGIALVIGGLFGVGVTAEKNGRPMPWWSFVAIGVLAITNATIALFWR